MSIAIRILSVLPLRVLYAMASYVLYPLLSYVLLHCASIRNFAENRLLTYICLYKLGLNYMGAILAVKFEKEILP